MNLEEKLIHVAKNGKQIREAISILEAAEFDTGPLEFQFSTAKKAIETYIPPEYPPQWRIRSTPVSITEQVGGDEFKSDLSAQLDRGLIIGTTMESKRLEMTPENLHHPTSNGRMFRLTAGQRAVLRERYGMTPTKEIVVDEVAVWPAEPTCVRHLVIRSSEHVDKGRRHVLNACVITDWVGFCEAVQSAEANAAITADKERLAARVDRLFDRAKAMNVPFTVTKGKILFKWLAEYDAIPLSDEKPILVRDALREILASFNETGLINLIKEPKFFDDDVRTKSAGNERFADLLSQYT